MKKKALALLLVLAALLSCQLALAEDTLTLPASLKIIKEEAFLNSAAKKVVLPEGVEEIHSRAFAQTALEEINLPSSLRLIADDAFDQEPNVLFTSLGSYAYNWAVNMGWSPTMPALHLNQRQTVTVTNGESHDYMFTAPATTTYFFHSFGELDTFAQFFDSNGNIILREYEDVQTDNNFAYEYSMTAGQTVTLRVYLHWTVPSGSFDIEVATLPTTLQTGSQTVKLGPGEHRTYSFTAPTAGTYHFYSSGSLDTYAILRDSSGNELARNDDGGEYPNYSLKYPMTAGQTVQLEVYSYAESDSGSFIAHVNPITGVSANTLQLGDNALTLVGDEHPVYSFTVPYTGIYRFSSRMNSLDPAAILYDSNENELCRDDNSGSYEYRNFEMTCLLTEEQTVYLEVYIHDVESGTYTIPTRVESIAGESLPPLQIGSNPMTYAAGEKHSYLFTAPVAGIYRFHSADTLDTDAVLYDDHAKTHGIGSAGEGESFSIKYALLANQQVFLEVEASQAGSFDVLVDLVTDTTLQIGSNPVTFAEDEERNYSFTAPAAGTYRFYSTGTLDPYATLCNSDNITVLYDDNSGEDNNFLIEYKAMEGEQFLLCISSRDAAGSFDVHVDLVEAGTTPAPDAPKYRALIIGNVYDDSHSIGLNTLLSSDSDRITMQHMLRTMTATPYTITAKRNLTSNQILSSINTTFRDATSNDVSLFFFAGHGGTLNGYLIGTDHTGISYAQLRYALDKIPGKKIVLLDCCYSGNAINKSSELDSEGTELTAADLDAVNRRIIQAFSGGQSTRSGELAADSYYVLTSASKDQEAWSRTDYSFFTCALEYGSGWDARDDRRITSLLGDSNGDSYISLQEAYDSTDTNLR